jgi:hypothetical protein
MRSSTYLCLGFGLLAYSIIDGPRNDPELVRLTIRLDHTPVERFSVMLVRVDDSFPERADMQLIENGIDWEQIARSHKRWLRVPLLDKPVHGSAGKYVLSGFLKACYVHRVIELPKDKEVLLQEKDFLPFVLPSLGSFNGAPCHSGTIQIARCNNSNGFHQRAYLGSAHHSHSPVHPFRASARPLRTFAIPRRPPAQPFPPHKLPFPSTALPFHLPAHQSPPGAHCFRDIARSFLPNENLKNHPNFFPQLPPIRAFPLQRRSSVENEPKNIPG